MYWTSRREAKLKVRRNQENELNNGHFGGKFEIISQSVDISRTTIWRFIKYELHHKSYIIQTYQELYEEDFDRRLEMAEIVMPLLESSELAGLIFFSDEATFHTSGYVHKNNCQIWGTEKPNESTHLKETVRKWTFGMPCRSIASSDRISSTWTLPKGKTTWKCWMSTFFLYLEINV